MFIFDDVCKMFSPRGQVKLKSCTYYKGSHRGFKEVCFIATRYKPTRQQLQALHKKHRLVLSIDYPDNLFFSFPV